MQAHHYKILGLTRTANDRDIRQAYRKLALSNHPDKNTSTDATEQFTKIHTAYTTLSDPMLREIYDDYLDSNEQHFNPTIGAESSHVSEEDFNLWIKNLTLAARSRDSVRFSLLLQQTPSMRIASGMYRFPLLNIMYDTTEINRTFKALMVEAISTKNNEIAILLIKNGFNINFEQTLPTEHHLVAYFHDGVRSTSLQMMAFFDNFALATRIGLDEFDLNNTLHCKYGEYQNPLKELFWLNLICHWAIKNQARDWLQSLLQKQPSSLAKNTIKKYLDYSQPMTQLEYRSILKKVQQQQQFDVYIAPHLARWILKADRMQNHQQILAVLGREGWATTDILHRYKKAYHSSTCNPCYSCCSIIAVCILLGLIGIHSFVAYRKENFGINEREPEFIPLTTISGIVTLYPVFTLINLAIALTAKAIHRENIDITAGIEDIALRGYQNYLLLNILKDTNTLNDEPQITECYFEKSWHISDCFRTMFNRHKSKSAITEPVDYEANSSIDNNSGRRMQYS